MRLFLKGVLPALALAIPCCLTWTASASAAPDARATVDRNCVIDYSRSKNVWFPSPLTCVHFPNSGIYKVLFKNPVNRCTITGTLGVANLPVAPSPGEISLATVSALFPRVVEVHTFNSSGYHSDNGFRLNVECD